MKIIKKYLFSFTVLLTIFCAAGIAANAQIRSNFEVLTGPALTKVVPTSFYFAGQSAETQIRNSAAAKLGENRYIIVGLVDTSGYSTEISGKYEGFFITDSLVKFGTKILQTGAYGFGFAKGDKINIFDLSGKQ